MVDFKECFYCKRSIVIEGKSFQVEDRFYHDNCIRCTYCMKLFNDDEIGKDDDGDLYCIECFRILWCDECFNCKKDIDEGREVVYSGSVPFHWDCYTCSKCRKHLYSKICQILQGKYLVKFMLTN